MWRVAKYMQRWKRPKESNMSQWVFFGESSQTCGHDQVLATVENDRFCQEPTQSGSRSTSLLWEIPESS